MKYQQNDKTMQQTIKYQQQGKTHRQTSKYQHQDKTPTTQSNRESLHRPMQITTRMMSNC